MNKILAQDEVDALLRGLSGGEIESETDIPIDDSCIVPFDLANQDRIIRGRMPVLEIVNDRFARLCTNALTNAVRKRVELNPISIDMTKFGRRAVLSLRQNLASRILDLEKAALFEKYSEKVGEIIAGEVYQVWKKEVLILDD